MRLNKILTLLIIIIITLQANAQFVQPMGYKDYTFWDQLNIGNNGAKQTDPSAYLELGKAAGSKKGFLLPRGNKDSLVSPVRGLMFYDIPTQTVWYFNGTIWIRFGSGFFKSSDGEEDVIQNAKGFNYTIDSAGTFSIMANEIKFIHDNIIDVEDSADYYMVVQNKDGHEIGKAPWPDQTKARFGYPGEDANIDVGREITFNQVQLSMAGLSSFNVLSNNLANTFGSVIYTNPTQNYLGGYNDDPAGAPFVGTSLNGIIYGGTTSTHRKAVAMGIGDASQAAEFFVMLDSSDLKLKAATYNINGLVEVSDSTVYKSVVADIDGNLFIMNRWPVSGAGSSTDTAAIFVEGAGIGQRSFFYNDSTLFQKNFHDTTYISWHSRPDSSMYALIDTAALRSAMGGGGGGGSGTVTSVALTVPSFLSVSGSPITSNGTFAITLSGTALPIANGGTGSTTLSFVDLSSNQSPIGGTKLWSSAHTFNALATFGGGYSTGGSSTANSYIPSGSSAAAQSFARFLFLGTSVAASQMFNGGTTNYALPANNAYGGIIDGEVLVTENSTGNHAGIFRRVSNPPVITNGTATTTHAGNVFINGNASGITPTELATALYVKGRNRFDGVFNSNNVDITSNQVWGANNAGTAMEGKTFGSSGSTIAITHGTGTINVDIANDAVTYARMQNVSATNRFLGRITTGAGDAEELTGAQATSLLDVFTTSLKGLVPAATGGNTSIEFLRKDGTWAVPSGGGGPNYTVQTLTDGGTITWTASSGVNAQVTLAGTGRTLTISSPTTGYTYTLRIIQDGTGSRTITTWPTNTKWPNGGTAPTLSTGAGQYDVVQFYYDGTNYYATQIPNFN